MAPITQIRIGGRLVGIVGIEEAIGDAGREKLGYEDARNFLLERTRRKNYIPTGLEGDYQDVMASLYCQRVGIPLPEKEQGEAPSLTVRILGPDCTSCQRLEQEGMTALMELDLPADLLHVTDIKEIASYGVTATPGLVINGKVVSVGSIPSRAKMKEMILEQRGSS